MRCDHYGAKKPGTVKIPWLYIGIGTAVVICVFSVTLAIIINRSNSSADTTDESSELVAEVTKPDSNTASDNSLENFQPADRNGNLAYSEANDEANDHERTTSPSEDEDSSTPKFDENVFRRFLDNEEYRTLGDGHCEFPEEFDEDYDPIAYSLYDIDADSVPEILIFNGADGYAFQNNYAYGYVDGSIIYLGDLPGQSTSFRHGNQRDFPGVFTSDAHTGSFWTNYYFRQENSIIEENVLVAEELMDESGWTGVQEEVFRTSVNGLFEANENARTSIEFISKDDYKTMGWDAFIKKCGYSSASN